MKNMQLPLIIISLLFIGYRIASCVIGEFPVNSAPIAALFFCGILLAGRAGFIVTSLLWLVSYPILSLLQGYPVGSDFLTSVLGFGLIVAFAFLMRGQLASSVGSSRRGLTLIAGSLLSAVAFYILTNTASWLSMPLYAKTWEGFTQAQWTGHPTLSLPTWIFFRNTLVANGAFAILIVFSNWKLSTGGAKVTATHATAA